MNTFTKTVLSGALLTAVIAASSAQADQVGDLTDYVENSVAVESVEIQKVSFQSKVADYSINR